MKIDWKNTAKFLANPAQESTALLLYGADQGLARERAQMVMHTLLGKDHDPLSLLEIYESDLLEDGTKLHDELCSITLLGGRRVILIRQAGNKLTDIMESVKDVLTPEVYIIVLAPELESKSSLRAWFEKGKNTAAMACYQDEQRDVTSVIREAMQAKGKQISHDVMQYMASQMGNDRYVTRQEIEKILIFMGDETSLSLADAIALTDYNRDTNADDVVQALADKNLTALDESLQRLAAEGMVAIQHLRAALRYFQRLYHIRLQAGLGSVEAVIDALRPPVFYKQKPHLIRHAKQWDSEMIAQALALISAAELACKTSDVPTHAASSRKLMQASQLRSTV